ncbi:MAG: acetyl-CoA carboxylase biotin carboxyl carrier protein subunit [bacterium]|nr:acetyl-CoA carboxylase biotin carboxyl carrier protein subunit [bacterium]
MRNFKFKVNGNEYEANVKSVNDDQLTIAVNGVDYVVDIEKKEKKTPILNVPKVVSSSIETNMKTSKPGDLKPNSIKAPIPGTVLQINCKVGDKVILGDTIILLEAMKMQNEIHATASGTVSSISVKTGSSVMEGDELISIEK